MSTLALDGSSETRGGSRAAAVARNADLGLLALALPIFIVAGLPLLGYAVCAGAWLIGRAMHLAGERRAKTLIGAGNRKAALGTMAAVTMGRVWLVALAILLVGLHEREAGLAAAVMTMALVTLYFAGQGIGYLFEPEAEEQA